MSLKKIEYGLYKLEQIFTKPEIEMLREAAFLFLEDFEGLSDKELAKQEQEIRVLANAHAKLFPDKDVDKVFANNIIRIFGKY